MPVLLISTYELGHQPFGLASPATWLRDLGAEVTALDTAVQDLPAEEIRSAELIAVYLPMHTATRLAVPILEQVRSLNPRAHVCCYGLYAPVNEVFLRKLGVATVLGGEFEEGLCALARRLAGEPAPRAHRIDLQIEPVVSLPRLDFRAPDRAMLPALADYAHLDTGTGGRKVVGYTEATRGCKHLCRHCPVVPVYNGHFRVVQRDVVLEDVRRQVAAGAEHITFGDPDFLNGPAHGMAVVRALHAEFPHITYDCTIKIEHLVKHRDLIPQLRDTGCLFVTSAVEAVDPLILDRFDKRHTRQEFVDTVHRFREAGLAMNPTFVAFTPWTTPHGYLHLLEAVAELDLVDNVAPVQYAIRLLIPEGSRLLELDDVRAVMGPFDEAALCYPWRNPDPRVDRLQEEVMASVMASQGQKATRRESFARVWDLATALAHGEPRPLPAGLDRDAPGRPAPSMSEPWYCCAEPTPDQFRPFV
ncbi:CUAEP/CCAEP-tail radical SAM (seleno)protein [Saccharothrix syringae]|uniref:Radical SAM protein n=1 Tax=Saccharothrix syringae TaxID=103733 RepID=A0A5Q0HDT2_SACSY|nr:CUAEP/CCAEP-tail radical SAM protein [Saccharothrix syringae]QFZ24477.1 radical SAM protein [Saccharothrix syringae]